MAATTSDFSRALGVFRGEFGELTTRQLSILCEIYSSPQQTVKGLAERFALGKPTVTRSVDRLELEQLAFRVVDPQDRRMVRISLTSKGQTLMDGVQKALA